MTTPTDRQVATWLNSSPEYVRSTIARWALDATQADHPEDMLRRLADVLTYVRESAPVGTEGSDMLLLEMRGMTLGLLARRDRETGRVVGFETHS